MQSSRKHVGFAFRLQHCWATCYHSIFVVRKGKTSQKLQKNVSTIPIKLYYTEGGVRMGRKVSKWQNKRRCWRQRERQVVLTQVNAPNQEDRRITVTIQPTSSTLYVDLHIPLCTRTWGMTEFVQGGCQSNLMIAQTGTRGNVHAIFAETSWRRRGFPATECHRRWNMGTPLWTCKQTLKHGVETHANRPGPRNSADKPMTLFWKFNGPTLEHYQNRWQTVNNSAWYCDAHEEEMKPAVRSKRRRILTNGVVLHYNNARSHTAAATIERIRASLPPCI